MNDMFSPERHAPRANARSGDDVASMFFPPHLLLPSELWPSVKMASIMEGPLSKWTNVMKGWQYRWFVLDYNAGLLSYYTVSTSKIDAWERR